MLTCEHDARQKRRVVPHFFTVFEKIGANDNGRRVEHAGDGIRRINRINGVVVNSYLVSTFQRITLRLFFGDASVVDDYKIEMNFRSVMLYRFQVLPRGVVVSLAGLSH